MAVSAKVSRVTYAGSGHISIPELVLGVMVVSGHVTQSLTYSVSAARAVVRVIGYGAFALQKAWAAHALASAAFESRLALTQTGLSVTYACIGTFHVVVRGLGQLIEVAVCHSWEALTRAIRIRGTIHSN